MRYPCIMTNEDAEQLALDGLAPRKRRKRAPAVKTPAAEHPIAQVVLDIQATHLGQTFDYFVEEKYSAAAQPGVMVRVRFGGQRVNGIIWKRADTSATPESSIRYIERVVTDRVLVPESMRDDMTRIADAFGARAPISSAWQCRRAWQKSKPAARRQSRCRRNRGGQTTARRRRPGDIRPVATSIRQHQSAA